MLRVVRQLRVAVAVAKYNWDLIKTQRDWNPISARKRRRAV